MCCEVKQTTQENLTNHEPATYCLTTRTSMKFEFIDHSSPGDYPYEAPPGMSVEEMTRMLAVGHLPLPVFNLMRQGHPHYSPQVYRQNSRENRHGSPAPSGMAEYGGSNSSLVGMEEKKKSRRRRRPGRGRGKGQGQTRSTIDARTHQG